MPTSPNPVDRLTSTRRRARLGACVLLALGALLALCVSSALADAGNPINGTTRGDLVKNPDGTVTVYVRGQWNWLSHKSDCNFDRAATGLSMVWNDPTETGYPLTGKFSAQVGVKSKDKSWEDPNPIDGMVHPVDRGNIPEKLPGVTKADGFKADQKFEDPAPQAAGETHPTANWRGGCGREPLTHVDAYTGFPWGSWGYEKESEGTDKNTYLGYSHVYRSLEFTPKSVCVNFYDIHGGAKESDKNFLTEFQVPNSSSSLDVVANHDNSIEENDFDVNGGSCVHIAKITTKATASAGLGEKITDTATIKDAFTNGTAVADGEVTFKAYKDPTTCTGEPAFTSGPTAVDLDKSTEVTSGPFSPLSIGTYYWIATYHSTADPQAIDISTTCKEAGETSEVGKAKPQIATEATTSATVGEKIKDVATLSKLVSPTGKGSVTFDLFKGTDCSVKVTTLNATPSEVKENGKYTSEEFETTSAGEYHWIAHFSGDANNEKADGLCSDLKEKTTVNKAKPEIATEATESATVGEKIKDVATLSKLVNPTGKGSVTFDLFKGERLLGQSHDPERDPERSQRKRQIHLRRIRNDLRRRVSLDRPLLRRRQQRKSRRPLL